MPKLRHFAIVGDVHGHHDTMVQTIERLCSKTKLTLDAVFQVGDFEPHRHEDDLRTMSAPSKYKNLGQFHHYFQQRSTYPWPVYFIGGNHEPYGWLAQHPEGFELMPGCTYLGRAGVKNILGLEIAFLTGIYERVAYDTFRPPVENLAYVSNKSFIYFNQWDINKIMNEATKPVDILLMHDWPTSMMSKEDWQAFGAQTHRQKGVPGHEPGQLLLALLEPSILCCGHMHMRYESTVPHDSNRVTQCVGLDHMRERERAVAIFEQNMQTGQITLVPNLT